MYVDVQTIISVSALITAILTIGGLFFTIFKWFRKQKRHDIIISDMQDEQCLLTYGVLACLKGLSEQGCNGPVTEAINKIEKHLNLKAHEHDNHLHG